MDRQFLVLDIVAGRYKCIGKDLVIFDQGNEPPESWFDPTTVSIAKGNEISLSEAFITSKAQINPNKDVDRFEVIDHRQCVYCRGRMTANYRQKDGSYKEQPCDKCDGSGIRGGRVYGAFSNAETSIIKVELSYQDDGKTLKVFVSDRA